MYMKNAMIITTIIGSNHMNTFNNTTAIRIAIIINIKSLNSM